MKNEIIVFTNINLEVHFKESISKRFKIDYNNIKFVLVSETEMTVNEINFSNVLLVLFWINFQEQYPEFFIQNFKFPDEYQSRINNMIVWLDSKINTIKKFYFGQIFFVGFEYFSGIYRYCLWNIEEQIAELDYNLFIWAQQKDIICINLKELISEIGLENALDPKAQYRFNIPYKKTLFDVVAGNIYKKYFILMGQYIKCVILDCDNVLWKGNIDEGGIVLGDFGIGRKYKDFQRYMKLLFNTGTMLALCTKNDAQDIRIILRNNEDMVLEEKDFVGIYANWDDKYQNIMSLAELLNIDYENMVFIDDSLYEVQHVQRNIPEINAVLFDIDKIYKELSGFNFPYNLQHETIINRLNTFKYNQKRALLSQRCNSFVEYLAELKINTKIKKAEKNEYKRISELSMRTNKCSNLARMNEYELEKHEVFAVYVSDLFGDLGLVGAIAINNNVLKLFCLSCRALGRDIEKDMINFIVSNYKINEIEFIKNKKNNALFDLLQVILEKNKC